MEAFIPAILTVITAWVTHRVIHPKAKVIWAVMHGFTHFVPNSYSNDGSDDVTANSTDDATGEDVVLYCTGLEWIPIGGTYS